MQLVPAPGRHFKTWSMWLLIAAGSFDIIVLLLEQVGDIYSISTTTLAVINATLAAITAIARLINQQISITPEQQAEIIQSVVSQPVVRSGPDIEVKIDNQVVAIKPPEPLL